ncbi:PucR family transcriptional regulator [Nonomuraea rhodomycinica]|uniref:PucR family transcriptional regulator n=1 Tax=Nonomuraea rhodomycinica TaxID=1712872 RepID=A0A7Y6IMG0_9ACTN|nr:PucR family transcriptional regulator [Nonomuraea rhodomycinica]NUW40656.1 PucR family transcriptional regulator [Nonomuraea rhodomycinica]
MAPSLRVVVRRMGLRPLAGSVEGVVVRWVAVSELEDPTPYLEGEELLLTTGMRLESDFSGYVARLVARGVAGLGFAVGLTHEDVPPGLVQAAADAGLPLLEVPREVPFIAIGKAVSELLAAEQYDEIKNAFAAQGRLTRAALRPEGPRAVVDRLAKEIGGWAALLDETGEVRHASPGAQVGTVVAELTRLGALPGHPATGPAAGPVGRPGAGPAAGQAGRPGAGPAAGQAGRPASLAWSGPAGHMVVLPLGGGPRPRGFFAAGSAQPFSPVGHTVLNAAGSLLTLALEQGGARLEAERRLRSSVLELLLAGAPERARAVLEPVGGRLPEEPLVVLAAPDDALEALEPHAFTVLLPESPRDLVSGVTAEGSGAALAGAPARSGGVVVAVVGERAADQVAALAGGPVGASVPCSYGELTGALDQAGRALAAAAGERGERRVVRFGDLAGQGLLRLLDPAAARAFAGALLAPLTRYGSRADLVESLRAYLSCNGHWDAAAQRLGVHRHTLRYRMRRVAELLGRDLDDPGVRAELWIALAATDPATGARPDGREPPT